MSDDFTHTTTLTCYKHPNRETMLRCSRCDRPICTECAVLTPTGYRCNECIKGQQKVFDTAQWIDYPLAIAIGAGLSYVGSLFIGVVGFFTIFIAPLVGLVISEAIRRIVHKRRSNLLFRLSAAAAAVGSLPLLVTHLAGTFYFLGSGGGYGGLLSLLWYAVYTFMVTSTTYYRLSGIQL